MGIKRVQKQCKDSLFKKKEFHQKALNKGEKVAEDFVEEYKGHDIKRLESSAGTSYNVYKGNEVIAENQKSVEACRKLIDKTKINDASAQEIEKETENRRVWFAKEIAKWIFSPPTADEDFGDRLDAAEGYIAVNTDFRQFPDFDKESEGQKVVEDFMIQNFDIWDVINLAEYLEDEFADASFKYRKGAVKTEDAAKKPKNWTVMWIENRDGDPYTATSIVHNVMTAEEAKEAVKQKHPKAGITRVAEGRLIWEAEDIWPTVKAEDSSEDELISKINRIAKQTVKRGAKVPSLRMAPKYVDYRGLKIARNPFGEGYDIWGRNPDIKTRLEIVDEGYGSLESAKEAIDEELAKKSWWAEYVIKDSVQDSSYDYVVKGEDPVELAMEAEGEPEEETAPLRVCEHCLQGIEAHEGRQFVKPIYFDGNNGVCDWCEEDGFDKLYEILEDEPVHDAAPGEGYQSISMSVEEVKSGHEVYATATYDYNTAGREMAIEELAKWFEENPDQSERFFNGELTVKEYPEF